MPDPMVHHTFKPLVVETTRDAFIIAGGTFRYSFSREHGLITSIRLLGREWLAGGRPCPDLWVGVDPDPVPTAFEAARERRARVVLKQITDEKVILRTEGRYLDKSGDVFPMTYQIDYAIDVDGVVEVDVENRGRGSSHLRYLVFSKATLPARFVESISHTEDLAKVETRTGGFQVTPVREHDGPVLQGGFLPWLQFGNDRAGIDLTVDSAEAILSGFSSSYGDLLGTVGATCDVQRKGRFLTWEYFSIRNVYTPIRSGWRRRNRFYLGVVPAKDYDPRLADLRVHWPGPHQIRPGYRYPTDDEIDDLARRGINTVVGCAEWRSGHYAKALEPAETRRVIKACHRNGMKVIPYITFTDLNHDVPVYARHGEEWQIEPVAEFKHLTNLMCYGAEGWREYWKKDVDSIFDRFDFDGLYIDFWVGKMACTNPKHGCDHRYGRYTLPGVRDMAMHAYQLVKSRRPGNFILANTNLFSGALINNLIDVRLPGEWGNIERTPPEIARCYLNSRRLGCNALMSTGRMPRFTMRSVATLLKSQSQMKGWRLKGRELFMKYSDILRCFGVDRSVSLGAWEDDGSLRGDPRSLVTYWHKNERGALIVGVDTEGKSGTRDVSVQRSSRLGIRDGKRYLLYRPDARVLVSDTPVPAARIRRVSARLKPWEPLVVFAMAAKGRPQALWATLSDRIDESWSGRRSELTVTVAGARGGRTEATVYASGRKVLKVKAAGRALPHRKTNELVTFNAPCYESVVVTFET